MFVYATPHVLDMDVPQNVFPTIKVFTQVAVTEAMQVANVHGQAKQWVVKRRMQLRKLRSCVRQTPR